LTVLLAKKRPDGVFSTASQHTKLSWLKKPRRKPKRMADGPAKTGMGKEMGMANMEMSKGNMRGGCMHYMRAQKMSMMK